MSVNLPFSGTVPNSFKFAKNQKFAYSRLIAAAKKMRATSMKQAHGACLTMSLEFCLLAQQHGLTVYLVMWRVKDDPHFSDHWAVQVNPTQVVDLTRIQINPKPSTEVVFDVLDYPDNFSAPHFYLTAPLLNEYLSFKDVKTDKLPPVLIKNLRTIMLRQDFYHANHFENFSGFIPAIFAYLKFRVTFAVTQFEDRLQKRRGDLEKR